MSQNSADIEQRLSGAAQAIHERDLTGRRCDDLQARADQVSDQLTALRANLASEQEDVERLEGMSFTRVLASMAGSRDERLGRERAEAEAARYRVAEAEARLAAITSELQEGRRRLDALAGAPAAYAAVLEEKERYLEASGNPRGHTLLVLAEERGRLNGELKEADEALRAADAALLALDRARDRLSSASGWSTYDTFFGGGAIASAVKHERMDEAADATAEADQRLAVLRTELADVQEPGPTAPQLAIGSGTRFVDVWFDNLFTDLSVGHRIDQAQQNVGDTAALVAGVQARLRARIVTAQARLAAIESQRRELLVS
jgi:hypothetical protein